MCNEEQACRYSLETQKPSPCPGTADLQVSHTPCPAPPPSPCSGPSWVRPGVTSPTRPGNGAPPVPFSKVQLRLSPGKPWEPLDEGSEVSQLWPHVSHLGGDTRLPAPGLTNRPLLAGHCHLEDSFTICSGWWVRVIGAFRPVHRPPPG